MTKPIETRGFVSGANLRDKEPHFRDLFAIEVKSGFGPRRRMRHVTCRDAALAAVKELTKSDPHRSITVDEVEASMVAAGHRFKRATIFKVMNRDLAGIGTSRNSPSGPPVLRRLAGGRKYQVREDSPLGPKQPKQKNVNGRPHP